MLQLITDHPTAEGTATQALTALNGGCRWIQIRMKDARDVEVEKAVMKVLPNCRKVGATLIVDDRVELVKLTGADGVHLGKNDMNPLQARTILGPEKIIGATINSIEDIDRLNLNVVDYLGAGPFRLTTTKKRLAPILGLEGYCKLMIYIRRISDIPVVAIGGVTPEDIPAIMTTGISGIAVSGAINKADDPEASTRSICEILEKSHRKTL